MKEIPFDNPLPQNIASERDAPKGSEKAPAVRTFRTDVEDLVKEKSISKIQFLAAKLAKRERRGEGRVLEEVEDPNNLSRFILILGLAFAFVLGIGLYALLSVNESTPQENIVPKEEPPTLESANILLETLSRDELVERLSVTFGQTSLPFGKIRQVEFSVGDPAEGERQLFAQELFEHIFHFSPKDPLPRSLAPSMRYFIYSGTDLSGVLILESRSYPHTFAALLDWEPRMREELLPLLDPWITQNELRGLARQQLKDVRVENIDARTLEDTGGEVVLAYAFLDEQTLIFAGSLEALRASVVGNSP